MANGDGNLEISGCGDDVAENLTTGLILATSGGGGSDGDIIGVVDDPPGCTGLTSVSTNIKDVTKKALSICLASAVVSDLGDNLMSGAGSGDPRNVTYPIRRPLVASALVRRLPTLTASGSQRAAVGKGKRPPCCAKR